MGKGSMSIMIGVAGLIESVKYLSGGVIPLIGLVMSALLTLGGLTELIRMRS